MTNATKETSGTRVILLTLAGVVLVGAAVMIGFLFFKPEAQACANGPDALNPTVTPGVTRPMERRFETIAEAERWICHSVVYPRSPDVTLDSVTAFRSGSLQEVVEGNAFAQVMLSYKHTASGQLVNLTMSPFKDLRELEGRDRTGEVTPSANRFETHWQKDQLDIRMLGFGGNGFTKNDFEAIYDSVK